MAKQQVVLTEDDDDQQTESQSTEVELKDVTQQGDKKTKADEQITVIEDDGKGDEPLDVSGSASAEEKERQLQEKQHKETSKERRDRAKKARDRDRQELEYQRSQIAQLQRQLVEVQKQTHGTQLSGLQEQLRLAKEEQSRFEAIGRAATEAKNIGDAIQAMRYEQAASTRVAQIQQQLEQAEKVPQTRTAAAPPPFIHLARSFASTKPWYDPRGGNEDSAIVLAIDRVMAQEGFDPNSPTYWDELEKRVKNRLPQHYQNADDDDGDDAGDDAATQNKTVTRKAPPVGGSRSNAGGNPNVFRLSAERVAALKAANMWDDEKTRVKMAQKFREWDRLNKTSAS